MTKRVTGQTPHSDRNWRSPRNLHFGKFVAVGASSSQPEAPLEGAKWVIAAELPASLRAALDIEPRPMVSLGRFCFGHEPRAALVTVSTEYVEVHFIFPLGDSRTHAWRRESARVDNLTFVVVVAGEQFPFGVRVSEFADLDKFWGDASETAEGPMTSDALADECALVTGTLMAQHVDIARGRSDTPPDRHYVLISNEAFSAQSGDALDALVNAFLSSEPITN